MNRSLFSRLRRDLGPLEGELADAYAAGTVSRRTFLVRGSVLGLSVTTLGGLIDACGGDDDTATPDAGTADAGTADAGTADAGTGDGTADTPEPAAGEILQGGVLRIASQRPGSPLDPVAMDNIGSYTPVVQSIEYLCRQG